LSILVNTFPEEFFDQICWKELETFSPFVVHLPACRRPEQRREAGTCEPRPAAQDFSGKKRARCLFLTNQKQFMMISHFSKLASSSKQPRAIASSAAHI
jgi:hypothetical protein